jgi:twitching motility protein PilJ
MTVIQEITTQTSSGTTATAESIGNLAGMANELRESVAGFKLPDENGSVVELGRAQKIYDGAVEVGESKAALAVVD